MDISRIKQEIKHGNADKAGKLLSQYGTITRDDHWTTDKGEHRELDIVLGSKQYSYEMLNGAVVSISY